MLTGDELLQPTAGGPPIPAVAYRAAQERRLPAEAPPAPAYLAVMVKGAREAGLSDAAIEKLKADKVLIVPATSG